MPVVGLEEKRQITAVVAGALSGELLPLQLLFAGQDRDKKKQRAVPTLDPVTHAHVLEEGWHLSQTHNHWSTLESMKDYIRIHRRSMGGEEATATQLSELTCGFAI